MRQNRLEPKWLRSTTQTSKNSAGTKPTRSINRRNPLIQSINAPHTYHPWTPSIKTSIHTIRRYNPYIQSIGAINTWHPCVLYVGVIRGLHFGGSLYRSHSPSQRDDRCFSFGQVLRQESRSMGWPKGGARINPPWAKAATPPAAGARSGSNASTNAKAATVAT